MNSTSFESHPSRYTVSPQPAAGCEAESQRIFQQKALNLTSTPKYSFKAPTAEDFDKGTRAFGEHSVPGPAVSMLAVLWSKLFRRP